MDLFEKKTPKAAGVPAGSAGHAPLAERMRPDDISGFAGQGHLLGEGKFLRNILLRGELPSLILWGPPGCGKTTLARIMAKKANAEFVSFSAVLSGVKEIREVVSKAKEAQYRGKKTILFVDEIHRFNKSQQDAFLHSVEDGTITLIGATTENPSFEVNAPLLSRCKVLTLKGLAKEDIKQTLRRAAADAEKGLGSLNAEANDDALDFISEFSHGDMREALNSLEAACMITFPDKDGKRRITVEAAKEAMQRKSLLYDKSGEEHYNVVSAFIKSMRGSDPDAALYWLARMVEAGEDPLFIARRMVIFASEDIGNADPAALTLALSIKDAVLFVGMPEGWIPLAHGVTYLSTAPKSNASYTAYLEAKEDVNEKGALPVPLHLRNAPTSLMKDLGYGKDYKYPHNYKDAKAEQDYLPEVLKGKKYYTPPEKKKDK
ncbi:MAG TPA: replication-associated recombination protein A [Thermodesulfobacteriota bacterium]|nr:replication-associated recombination protein A [Thermodesulfobacteriota bacterium]